MDNRRKKLLFRASHRGMKEMDIILGGFAEKNLKQMSEDDVTTFETILDLPDPDLYNWITGKAQPPANADYSDLLSKIIKTAA